MKGEIVDWVPPEQVSSAAGPNYGCWKTLAELRDAQDRREKEAKARWLEDLEQRNAISDEPVMEQIPPLAPTPEDMARIEHERVEARAVAIASGLEDWWRSELGSSWRALRRDPSDEEASRALRQVRAGANRQLEAEGLEQLTDDELTQLEPQVSHLLQYQAPAAPDGVVVEEWKAG